VRLLVLAGLVLGVSGAAARAAAAPPAPPHAATEAASAAEPVWPDDDWVDARPADGGMDAQRLAAARDYALTGGGSGIVVRRGRAIWTADVARRGGVFAHRGRCFRGGVTYCAPLARYLWVQVLPGDAARADGGLAVFDAPEPWGPWTTAFFAERWDVGPGETASFPTKWMSDDGRTMHLVFSGDDAFSVRRATLEVTP